MPIDDGVNAMFYLSMSTLLITAITLCIRFCYKSKCSEVECCCFKIKRDVQVELEEDLNQPEKNSV
jgi:hypothetical protein